MKKSITSKIVLSYLIIILISMAFIGVFFSLTANRYLEKQVITNLEKDAQVLVKIVRSDFSSLRKEVMNENDTTEKKVQQAMKDTIRKSLVARNAHYAVLAKDFKILFPTKSNDEDLEAFKTIILPVIKENLVWDKRQDYRFKSEEMEYSALSLPIFQKQDGTGNVLGWAILYTSVDAVNEFEHGTRTVMLASIIFATLLAIVFGIITARSIAKPIIALRNRAELLSKRDFDTRVDIHTSDELEDLAVTMNKLAVEIKEYDMAQKKFLQNASHELKTPLMSIQGYAEGIKDGVFENNQRALDVIVEESTRLKSIVEELIFLSKLETMEDYYKFSSNNINEIIEKSVEKIKSIAVKNNVNINLMLNKDASLKVDRDKLTQALINVLGNCMRYARGEINISSSNNGGYFEITINDDGEGFEDRELKNIFERFYKGKKGNTGLGLAITKAIIEKHQGTIVASNGTNGGAEFKISLLM